MTQMTDSFATQTNAQAKTQTKNQAENMTNPTVQNNSAKGRTKYSGNDVVRLIRGLKDARLDMDRKCLSMNSVVHIAQDEIEEMLRSRRFSYDDLARIITMAGFPVTARTLKDYLAKARKDAKEGRTDHSELKQLILESAQKQENPECTNSAPFPAAEADSKDDGSAGNDDFAAPDNDWLASAISSSMDEIETAEKKKQHVQDIYAARKRRKKAKKRK